MENSIYIGLSRQMALKTDMAIIANNVANANTPGYRGQNTLFSEYISDPRGADDPLSFVLDRGQYQTSRPGPVAATSNPLDIYVNGPGFIGVETNDGIAYTRDGSMHLDEQGRLMSSSGFPIASEGGGAVTIPIVSTIIKIGKGGRVFNQNGEIGQIMVTEFENIQAMKPYGNNLYKTEEAGQPAVKSVVEQGHLEGSNVQPVVEMTRMIDTLRSYQSVQKFLESEGERLRGAIQRLTRVD